MNNIICIAGPTASGKTALAVELAKRLGGEVISCDSMQIYCSMDIGTAKPNKREMQGIPHYMLDVAHPSEDFSVSRYCEMADPILRDILARGKTAIIAGGTGLYMDALIKGNDFAPVPPPVCAKSWRNKQTVRAWKLCLRYLLPSIPMPLPSFILPTASASCGRWKSTTRPARPSPLII